MGILEQRLAADGHFLRFRKRLTQEGLPVDRPRRRQDEHDERIAIVLVDGRIHESGEAFDAGRRGIEALIEGGDGRRPRLEDGVTPFLERLAAPDVADLGMNEAQRVGRHECQLGIASFAGASACQNRGQNEQRRRAAQALSHHDAPPRNEQRMGRLPL